MRWRGRIASTGCLLVLTGLTVATPTGAEGLPAPGAVADRSSHGWGAPTSFDPFRGFPTDASCPTADFCALIDYFGGVLFERDGVWGPREQLPAQMRRISCSSATFCAAVSFDGQAVIYDGTEWSAPVRIDRRVPLVDVSCADPTLCVAVDRKGNALTYRGGLWGRSGHFGPGGQPAVSCPTTTFCLAAVGSTVWQFDGTDWNTIHGLLAPGVGVSCPLPAWCAIVDQAGSVEILDEDRWIATRIDDGLSLTGISCATTTACLAVDNSGRGLLYDGSEWAAEQSRSEALEFVSCAGVGSGPRCIAVDSAALVVPYDEGWQPTDNVDPPAGAPADVSCPTSRWCLVVDSYGNTLEYEDQAWSTPVGRDASGFVADSCGSQAFCVAVSAEGAASTYVDGVWSQPAELDVHGLMDVSCPSDSACMAVGGRSDVFRLDGSQWTRQHLRGPALESVSCSSATSCAATSPRGTVRTYDGSAWSAPVRAPGSWVDVSCSTTDFCVAVSQDGAYTRYDGASWSAPADTGGRDVRSIACSSDLTCVAVTWSGSSLTYAEGSWTKAQAPAREFTAISCPRPGSCTAVTDAGQALHYRG